MSQPDPTRGNRSQAINPRFREISRVIMDSQYEAGIETYGTPLMTFNGRQALKDLLAEWVDLGQYATQELMEREYLESLLREAIEYIRSSAFTSHYSFFINWVIRVEEVLDVPN